VYRDALTLRILLRGILSDISQKTMYVSKAVKLAVRDIESEDVTLIVAGYTGHSMLVKKEIMAAGIDVTVLALPHRHMTDDVKFKGVDPRL
jgi:hypothetical protein